MATRTTDKDRKKSGGKSTKKSTAAAKSTSKKTPAKKTAAKKTASAGSSSKRSKAEDISIPERRARSSAYDGYTPAVEAGILILLAVCILLFLSNFGVIGSAGTAVASFLFGIFGSASYIFPFALFFTVVMLVANRFNYESVTKSVMIWLTFLIIAMFFAMAWSGDFETRKQSYTGDPYFRYGMEFKRGGGLIPGHIYAFMSDVLGQFGTVIIMVTVAIICIGVLTGRSIIKLITESSREAADSLVDNIEIRQEEIRRDRRQRRRSEGIHYGRPQPVGNTISKLELKSEEEESDEMKELTASEAEDLDRLEKRLEERILATEQTVDVKELTSAAASDMDETVQEADAEEVVVPAKRRRRSTPVQESADTESGVRKRKVASSTIPDGMVVEDNTVSDYVLPDPKMLKAGKKSLGNAKKEQMQTAQKLKETLESFGINVTMTDVSQGPTVTRYEMLPDKGVKVSKIVSLTDDLKLALAAESIRIEAPIPGKSAIGIEVPNAQTEPVMLHDLIVSDEFRSSKSKISFAVGKDIGGNPVVFDIAKMPHVLIAGATGAGKSVCINTIIMSILYKARPDEVKLVMIDPKVVELSIYNGIPHLMTPVVTDPQKAAGALNWSVVEMDRRYNEFATHSVRDLKGYNAIAVKEGLPVMPQIVVIVDELADLMMAAKSDVETAIVRLAQKARAAGIHLIIATQRPSVDVITGLIKANMPSRVAFTVTSGVDSRTILDMVGAEKLLGKGDMLFYPVGYPKPARVQGAFVSDEEVEEVASFIRAQKKEGDEDTGITEAINAAASSSDSSKTGMSGAVPGGSDEDEIFMQVAEYVVGLDKETVSIGLLQRQFRLGFNRAARIMDQLTDEGIVGEEMGTKGRRIIMTGEKFEQYKEEKA